jgi:hypothetical protein
VGQTFLSADLPQTKRSSHTKKLIRNILVPESWLTMARDYSKHQRNIIKNYYENYDQIQLQKLQEQLTELYLAEGKAREKRWKNIIAALENLKVPASRIEHVRKSDDPQLLAKLIEELLAKQK